MFLLQFDACNRDILGIGSIGFVLYYDNIVLLKDYKLLKQPHNSNYAEYCALIYALDYVSKLNIKDLYVEGDAKIVIDQIKDICNIKSDIVKPLHEKVKKLIKKFDFINFEHIYRKYNIYADSLANQALLDYYNSSND
jgi:ribonuclease HI